MLLPDQIGRKGLFMMVSVNGMMWLSGMILASGAICSVAMIILSDHLQHREKSESGMRQQDLFQSALDMAIAQPENTSSRSLPKAPTLVQSPSPTVMPKRPARAESRGSAMPAQVLRASSRKRI